MCFNTSLSKHFTTIGVSSTGLQSFSFRLFWDWDDGGCLQAGKNGSLSRDRLKILVNTAASWSAHSLSTFPGTRSGLVAFLGLTDLSTRLTSCSCIVNGQELEAGGDCTSGAGLFTSKQAKKQFSSSASEASVWGCGVVALVKRAIRHCTRARRSVKYSNNSNEC